ncbi:hypothetical protein CIK74_03900 [Glutamicibacter sp. BW77]|nr:hypothetical protein CIK74_03900 [Glutamicibacter sp. BW77]
MGCEFVGETGSHEKGVWILEGIGRCDVLHLLKPLKTVTGKLWVLLVVWITSTISLLGHITGGQILAVRGRVPSIVGMRASAATE